MPLLPRLRQAETIPGSPKEFDMLLMPSRVKFRKQHRGKMRGIATAGHEVHFGDYGLKALGRGWLTALQIEAARVALGRHVKRGGKIWVRTFQAKSYHK